MNKLGDGGRKVGRYWTAYWRFRYWRPDINGEGKPVRSSGSNSFRNRGVSVGDTVYVVSQDAGQLYLGGRMVVKRIISRAEAVRLWKTEDLYDAEEWIADPDQSGTLLHLRRRLSPALTKQLRFLSSSGPMGLFFRSDTELLDSQTMRGVRELTPESAALLDRIVETTDRLPNTGQLITVTEELLEDSHLPTDRDEFRIPEEVPSGSVYSEGSVRRIEVNRYERDTKARTACIAFYGSKCYLCMFDFGAVYGPEAEGHIHVHHERPLSEVGPDYVVDPIEDLKPVCPNCHAVLHLDRRCRSIEEVKLLLRGSEYDGLKADG